MLVNLCRFLQCCTSVKKLRFNSSNTTRKMLALWMRHVGVIALWRKFTIACMDLVLAFELCRCVPEQGFETVSVQLSPVRNFAFSVSGWHGWVRDSRKCQAMFVWEKCRWSIETVYCLRLFEIDGSINGK